MRNSDDIRLHLETDATHRECDQILHDVNPQNEQISLNADSRLTLHIERQKQKERDKVFERYWNR
jgi:hypothetical protein